jgi:hypothetical protein
MNDGPAREGVTAVKAARESSVLQTKDPKFRSWVSDDFAFSKID